MIKPAASLTTRRVAIPQAKIVIVLRDDVRLEVDRSRYFELDRVPIKATIRVGIAFPHSTATVRLYDWPSEGR